MLVALLFVKDGLIKLNLGVNGSKSVLSEVDFLVPDSVV